MGGVVTEEVADAIHVGLCECCRIGRALQQVLELVEVAEVLHRLHRLDIPIGSWPSKSYDWPQFICGNMPRRLEPSWSSCQRRSMSSSNWSASCCICARCSGDIEFSIACIAAIRRGDLLEQLVEVLRVLGEEVAELLHELLETRVVTALAPLEHLVQPGEHVLHALHVLRRHALHAL